MAALRVFRGRIAMAARAGVAPAGDGLRYAEYLPPSAQRRDAEIDHGLVSAAGSPRPSRAPVCVSSTPLSSLASCASRRPRFPAGRLVGAGPGRRSAVGCALREAEDGGWRVEGGGRRAGGPDPPRVCVCSASLLQGDAVPVRNCRWKTLGSEGRARGGWDSCRVWCMRLRWRAGGTPRWSTPKEH